MLKHTGNILKHTKHMLKQTKDILTHINKEQTKSINESSETKGNKKSNQDLGKTK